MGKVVVLDEATACKIAAGEVIERPASVVKELIENSIDAGATKISVEITSGGIKMIKIIDNGSGFEQDDALLAFDKHATSKIISAEDLTDIKTLGFRGEALASIASVSEVTLVSKTADTDEGVTVKIKGSVPEYCRTCGCNKGTCITVKNLFFNTPARYKFLKKDSTEAGYVADVIEKMSINRPDIAFSLQSNGNTIINTPGNGDLKSAVYSIFGKELTSSLLPVDFFNSETGISVTGFIGTSGAVYKTRARQYFYVNGRVVKNKFLSVALDESVKTSVMKGMFPFAVIKIQVPTQTLDVNVHPMKTEVRFSEESNVFSGIYAAVRGAFTGETSVKQELPLHEKVTEFNHENVFIQKNPEPKKEANYGTNSFVNNVTKISENNSEIIKEFLNNIKTEKQAEKPAEKQTLENPTLFTIPDIQQEDKQPSHNTLVGMSSLSGEKTENADIFENATVVGQVFNTYILLESGQDMFIIDQHAAHERLMYEDIRHIIETRKFNTQILLTPLTVKLSQSEYAIAKDNLAYFENMGFEIEDFGGETLIVRAIPVILKDSDISGFIAEGVSCIEEGVQKKFFSDKAVYTMACKAAVKGNHHLSYSEIEELLKRISKISGPATCPHGRPFYIRITRSEMDRKFKR